MSTKKLVKNLLNKTEIDDKIVAKYNENPGLYQKIWCHCKCYGGYILAVGAGCTFGASFWWGLGLTAVALFWGYKVTCKCKSCKKGSCDA